MTRVGEPADHPVIELRRECPSAQRATPELRTKHREGDPFRQTFLK